MLSENGEIIMDKTLHNLEKLYNCNFYFTEIGKQKFLELHTMNILTRDNIVHIKHILKQYGYYFYKIEAIFDNLIITYYKK